jgi:Leucine-rich repeat (LRR) protein
LNSFTIIKNHCLDLKSTDNIDLNTFLQLLKMIPPEREQILQQIFENISIEDQKKNKMRVIKAYKLMGLVKSSYSEKKCSMEEVIEVKHWLRSLGSSSCIMVEEKEKEKEEEDITTMLGELLITWEDFLDFHLKKNDDTQEEDAAFIAILIRLWHFQVPTPVENDTNQNKSKQQETILQAILQNYESRMQWQKNMIRKKQLLHKIQFGLEETKWKKENQLQIALQEIQHLSLQRSTLLFLLNQEKKLLALEKTATFLVQLKTVSIEAQSLDVLPEAICLLVSLIELNASNNKIQTIPSSIVALQRLETLRAEK